MLPPVRNRPASSPAPRQGSVFSVALAGGLLAAFVAIAAVWHVFDLARSDIEQTATHNLSAVAADRARQFTDFMSNSYADAIMVSSRDSVRRLASNEVSPAERPVLERRSRGATEEFRAINGYRRIAIFDVDLHSADGRPENCDLTKEETERLRAAIKFNRRLFVDLHQSAQGPLTFGLAQPIWAAGSNSTRAIGVAYLEFQAAQQFRRIFSYSNKTYNSERVVLLRPSGDAVSVMRLRTDETDELVSTVERLADETAIVSQALRASVGTILRGSLGNAGQVIGVAADVQDTPWVLLVSADAEEIGTAVKNVVLRLSAVAAVVLLMLAVVVVLLREQTKRAGKSREAALALRYSNAIRTMRDGFMRLNSNEIILDVNPAAETITGWNRASLIGRSIGSLAVAASTPPELFEADQQAIDSYRARWRRSDGKSIDIAGSKSPTDANGDRHLLIRDMTAAIAERRRLSRENGLHRLMHQSQHVIQRVSNREELLRELCHGYQFDPRVILILAATIDWGSKQVKLLESAGPAIGYAEWIALSADPAALAGGGLSGIAAREQRVVIEPDFQHSSPATQWRERAEKFGIRSSMSVPVIVSGQTVMMLCFYSDQVGYFDTDLTDLATQMGEAISVAFEAVGAREATQRLLEERAQSEARLRSIMIGAPVALVVVERLTGRMTFANAAFVKQFGEIGASRDHLEAHGDQFMAWLDATMVEPEQRQMMRDFGRQIDYDTAPSQHFITLPDFRLLGVDGRIHTHQAAFSRFGEEITFAFTDLTEGRAHQAEWSHQTAIYMAVAEQSSEPILLREPETLEFTQFNPAAHQMLGFTAEEFRALPPFEIVAPDDRETIREFIAQAEREGHVQFQTRLLRRDGSSCDILWSVKQIGFG